MMWVYEVKVMSSYEFCSTEANDGGTCISKHMSYKPRNDLTINKPSDVEST